ncbi:MAG: hypothetical protein K2P35_08645 [Lachnospiraceae bacterium]|nr:hypothetical protein [Lachnospiraceae bacterium]
MINFDDYPILKNNLSTLKETSIDDHDKNHITYMTDSNREAVHFDGVKNKYIAPLNVHDVPKSNDALFLNHKKELVFVEFKNGFMDGEIKFAVRKKIYDSIIILTDILDMGVGRLRDNMEYILVYNEAVNAGEKDVLNKKSHVQHSEAFNRIAQSISQMAEDEYVCFGIRMFEGYCFKSVHTYTEKEFEQYLKNH